MIVAIVNNGNIEQTGELSVLFPNVSFPASGPSDEWMAENNLVPVTYFKAYDAATQKLVSCEAYLEGGAAKGPYSRAKMGRMTTVGALTRETLVWTQGQYGWKKAEDVAELAQLFTVMPPPPPPAA